MGQAVSPLMPRVSVILPVYNGVPYLGDAVDSILAQDFADFELIAINDGSTDGSIEVLESFRDSRVKIVNQENRGLALTLRRGVEMACGEYLARQDQDDLSLPSRFSKQLAFMDAHPNCGVVGTWSKILKDGQLNSRGHSHPIGNGSMQVMSLFDSYFVHSSVMLRRRMVLAADSYPTAPDRNPPEDFDLWSRMSRNCEFANLPERLVHYRELAGSLSRVKADLIATRVHAIACANISHLVGLPATDLAVNDLVAIVRHDQSQLSGQTTRQDSAVLVSQISERLISRFPDDRDEILMACNDLNKMMSRVNRPYRFFRDSAIRLRNKIFR